MSVSSRQNGNDHLWSEFLASVATLVNKQTFETWFKPMRLCADDGARVTIDCPSKFFVEWVSEHHSDKIQFALRQVIGLDPQVALQNANDAPPEISRRPEFTPTSSSRGERDVCPKTTCVIPSRRAKSMSASATLRDFSFTTFAPNSSAKRIFS